MTTNREREDVDETDLIQMDGRTSEKLLDFKLVHNQFDFDKQDMINYNSNKMQES
jgi:hypothetical protein